MIKYFILSITILLTACNSSLLKDTFQKNPPDEFMVVNNLSLTIPPDYILMVPDNIDREKANSEHHTYVGPEKIILNHMNQYTVDDNIKKSFDEKEKKDIWSIFK